MKELYIPTRDEWRKWLAQNHDKSSGVWLVFYKKHTHVPTLQYDAAVEEALCFGWIDSIIKKLDEQRYARKITPRKPNSRWSEWNKRRANTLIKKGLMTTHGLARIDRAKRTGLWKQSTRPEISLEIPKELKEALAKNKKARTFFGQLAPTYQKQFIGWIVVAKRQETRDRRAKESIVLLENGKKLGLK